MSGLPLCSLYAHIIHITSLPKVTTIVITLSLFLLTFTSFLNISSFTKISTLDPSFSDHHSLYIRPRVPTKRAPRPFYPTSCMQHTSVLLFLSSAHTSVFLPQRLPIFQVPNLIPRHLVLNPEILCTPIPFKSCRGLETILFFLIGIYWSKILQGACPLLTHNLSFLT